MSIIHKLKLILMKSARNYKISMTRILAGVSLAFFASGIATAANESSSPHADAIESILQQKARRRRRIELWSTIINVLFHSGK